jgi:hypothetical protein
MAGETVSSSPLSWWQSWSSPNLGAGIINNGNGTLTITDGINYRVTIPGSQNFPDVLPEQSWFSPDAFHLYQYDSRIENAGNVDLMNWVYDYPTANFGNSRSTLHGTPNDATPTVFPQSFLAPIAPFLDLGDNRVHTYMATNELTGQPMNVNLTDFTHVLFPGAVLIQSIKNADGSVTLQHFGIGDSAFQSESYFPVLGQLGWFAGFSINSVWWEHAPSDEHPLLREKRGRYPFTDV